MHIILEEFLTINGRSIYCKVLSPTPQLTNRPWLLCIPGGPGFGHLSPQQKIEGLEKLAGEQPALLPNVILYDPLGCGKSQRVPPEYIPNEYSMNNFTEIACSLVEMLRNRFSPQQPMDLRVYGGSFGSMTAMDMPRARPQWTEATSPIQLKQILSFVGPNGQGMKEYARDFVARHYHQHPRYRAIRESLDKLLEGNILNEKDYIHSIAFTLAPLYSEDMERTLSGVSGFLVRNFLPSLIPVLSLVVSVGKKLSMNMAGLEFMIEGLTGCSVPVLNQFCRASFNNFNLQQQISEYLEIYKRVNISLISCNQDHMVDFRTALAIHDLLPDSSAAIILNERHMPTAGPHKDLMIKMMLGILCQGMLSHDLLSSEIIASHSVNSNFQAQLERLNAGAPLSTARTMTAIGAPRSREDDSARLPLPATSAQEENQELIEVINHPQPDLPPSMRM